jgi:acyl carrier protein
MTREEITGKLRALMKNSSEADVDWDAMTEESEISSLGFDSLSILDLTYDIQQCFGIEFDAEELSGIDTVAALVSFLEARVGS